MSCDCSLNCQRAISGNLKWKFLHRNTQNQGYIGPHKCIHTNQTGAYTKANIPHNTAVVMKVQVSYAWPMYSIGFECIFFSFVCLCTVRNLSSTSIPHLGFHWYLSHRISAKANVIRICICHKDSTRRLNFFLPFSECVCEQNNFFSSQTAVTG